MANYEDGFTSDPTLLPKHWVAWALMGDPHSRIPEHSVLKIIAQRMLRAVNLALKKDEGIWIDTQKSQDQIKPLKRTTKKETKFMIDRLTDRARKAVGEARAFAALINCEYLGTEHLLYGLIRDTHSVAAHALRTFEISEESVRSEARKLTIASKDPVSAPGSLPFTPRLSKALQSASKESADLGHNYIGTEHLLLGLLNIENSIVSTIFANFEVPKEDVRAHVLHLLGVEKSIITSDSANSSSQDSFEDVWLNTLAQLQKNEVEVEIRLAAEGTFYPVYGKIKEFDANSIVLFHEQTKDVVIPYQTTILVDRKKILALERKVKLDKDDKEEA